MASLQEPDTYGIKWEKAGTKPGLHDLYVSVIEALFKINTGVPFMIQGTGQAAVTNWGDGFITDQQTLSDNPGMSDPNLFFQTLVTKDYVNQVGGSFISSRCCHINLVR